MGCTRHCKFDFEMIFILNRQKCHHLTTSPSQYITMSPLMHVKKYSLQERVGKMLLIHGASDENDGTFPMQSERYFAALKAFGKLIHYRCAHDIILLLIT